MRPHVAQIREAVDGPEKWPAVSGPLRARIAADSLISLLA
jgi:hypothetical protein